MMDLRRKKVTEPYDIWTEDAGKSQRKPHPSLKRNKRTPLPHPGQSYNPDPEDHKRLLTKIAEKELKFQRKEKSLRKAVQVRVTATEVKKNDKEELESGIKHLLKKDEDHDKTNKDLDTDGSDTDDAYGEYDEKDFSVIAKDKKVKEKRKSKQQRLRQLKDKLQRKAAKLKKLKNIRLSKFDAIKKMSKELDKKEKEAAEIAKRRKHKRIKDERLGQKFEKSDPIYCLPSELPKNLRQVTCPMDSIVREQLESFQSRLMVEPTSYQVKKRKYKKKEFERIEAAQQEG